MLPMMLEEATQQLLVLYPRIFFACHTRHVRDPKTRRVLSAHQASILDHLDEREPLTLLDLAQHMGVTPSTMSLHVDRLVRRGYVLRERDSRDARRLRLRISAAGVRVREANSVLDPACVRKMLSRLTPLQCAAGLRGLALLARAADLQAKVNAGQPRYQRGRGRLPP
jgi:MarR family transcriptional regulator, organic hydroperoxide resistance regulator